jgi:predicted nucleotidyltransferase
MNKIFDQHTGDIYDLCKSHKVKRLFAFGSVLTDHFSEESDVDLIVDFDPIDILEYADNYFEFKFSLQDMLKRPIDLLEENSIKNPYFKKAIDQKRQLIYGQRYQDLAV